MRNAQKIYPMPAEGDIVWCRFPRIEQLGLPGPKSRPALVIAVSAEDHAIELVYGTSQKTHKIFQSEFVIDPADPGYSVSGLSNRTKFDFSRRVKLIFDDDWFDVAPGTVKNVPLPKLGVLHASYYQAAEAAFRSSVI